jgi:glycosyltransferase involved in cell wall biosynthesis
LRVCLMNDNFYRSSGVAIAIRRIAQASKGVDYYFAGCLDNGLQEDISWIPEGRYRRFDLKSSNPIRVISELIRIRKWLDSEECDLVHCHHRRLSVLLRLAGVRVLYTAQLAFPYQSWFRWLHPRDMTAITRSVAKNLVETTGQEPFVCIGNPAQFPERAPSIDLERVRFRAVCIARLDPVKGHTYLLSAWKLLHDKGYKYKLDLVGEGSLRSALEEQSRREGTQELVRFCGFHADVSTFIRDSLFAVLVSEIEGQGIVTLEAAAMGRPSLLTAVPGSIDLIPAGSTLPNGVDFGDVEKLAEALEEWFGHPDKVVAEGQRFSEFLKNSSDPAKVAHDYLDAYRRILNEST